MAKRNNRPVENRGRFQAQGGGVEKSTSWCTPDIPTKIEGRGKLENLKVQLTNKELAERQYCFVRAQRAIDQSPSNGIQSPVYTSFVNLKISTDKRVDLEINSGHAFKDD